MATPKARLMALAIVSLTACSKPAPERRHVGGTVAGLAGAGLALHSSLGDDLAISADGPFQFPTTATDGAAYEVTVKAQPTSPTQTCAVTQGSGTMRGGDAAVTVTCTTNTYRVGGAVSGLAGSGLVLQQSGGDDVAVSANGAFTFTTRVASGAAFAVAVRTQPSSPWQTCVVTGGTGTVVSGDVTSVAVSCANDTFSVGGSVTGLAGTGLVLQNAGGDDLSVTANGTFAFATPAPSGGAYAVTVKQQPTGKSQTCTVTSGSGSVSNAPVTSVAVECVTNRYAVGGTVTGLAGTGLVLRQSGADDLPIAADGSFRFATAIASGDAYAVAVRTQPSSPWQTCTVSGGEGAVVSADVSSVTVNCATNSYAIGGTVQGLAGSGLVLQQSGGDDLAISSNGEFAFATPVASGEAFDVRVKTQPTAPWQTCTVSSGTGAVASGAVSTVLVDCATNRYALGGSVSGLAGTGFVVQNGDDAVGADADGPFALGPVTSGAVYDVTVRTQPTSPWQTCTVTNGHGTVAGTAVEDVAVACATNAYAVGGVVTGLAGTGLVLQQSGADDLAIVADGSFRFATPVASAGAFAVTVSAQPSSPAQTCVVTGGAGTIGGGDVSSVSVNCTVNAYAVGGEVAGLAGGGLVLRQSGGDDLAVTANGAYAFATPVASGQGYDVTVAAQPTVPWQTCTVTEGSGTVVDAPITTAAVSCGTNAYAVGVTVTGLAGSGLVLQQGGADDLAVEADGARTFPTPVASGATYAVIVKTQPTAPWQTCTATPATGTVGGAAVDVAVTCTTDSYHVGGAASGVLASGLTVRNSGGDPLAVDANGPFTFPAKVASGAPYAVTAETVPPTQTCSVSNGTGTVAGADVTDVVVSCQCSPGRANCDAVAANGCEDDLSTASHCGACGNACSGTTPRCIGGTCALPPTCRIVNGIPWCYDPNACGQGCTAVCGAVGMPFTLSDAEWFAAQDTMPECQAISDAFGLTGAVAIFSFVYACAEDGYGVHTAPGGLIPAVDTGGGLLCSSNPSCPAAHRVQTDQGGVACGSGSRRSVCPCR